MDNLIKYREIVKSVLTYYYKLDKEQPSSGVDPFIVFDEVRDHYLWLQVGWDQTGRTCGSTVYIRLCDGKVWVEEDLTEDGITWDLLKLGVEKSDIVLGFHHPRERALTEFSVA
ncbi:MAG: XisI protein [Microcoleaceae cyanobacterium]